MDGESNATTKRYTFNFNTNDVFSYVVPIPLGLQSFVLTRSTGLFAGGFIAGNNRLAPFKGCVYQKGSLSGGRGFYVTPVLPGAAIQGQSLGVTLMPR